MDSFRQVIFKYAKDRFIVFSNFQLDATFLIRKLQTTYHVSHILLHKESGFIHKNYHHHHRHMILFVYCDAMGKFSLSHTEDLKYIQISRGIRSLDKVMKLCLAGSLSEIVSKVIVILRNPRVIRKLKTLNSLS